MDFWRDGLSLYNGYFNPVSGNNEPDILNDDREDADDEEEVTVKTETSKKSNQLRLVEVARSLKIKPIRQWAQRVNLFWLSLAIAILFDGSVETVGVLNEERAQRERRFHTRRNFAKSIDDLVKFNVLTEVERTRGFRHLAFSRYFEVAKKGRNPDGSIPARGIMDSRHAADVASAAGGPDKARTKPVNLPAIGDVLHVLSTCKFFWAADFKHWYYQIPIHEKLARLFTILLPGGKKEDCRVFIPKVLPQGWCWSCYLAQSMAWSIILFHESEEDRLYSPDDVPTHELPRWIPIRDEQGVVCGGVFLWYDNILVASKDQTMAHRWMNRIHKNAKKFGAEFSEFSTADSSARPGLRTVADYIGIHVEYRRSEGKKTWWRHTSDKVDKANRLLANINNWSTARIAGRIAGYAVWNQTLKCRSLNDIAEVLNIISRVSSGILHKREWDKEVSYSEADKAHMAAVLREIAENPWLCLPDPITYDGGVIRVATDASTYGYGYTVIGDTLESSPDPVEFSHLCEPKDIWLMELTAATVAIERLAYDSAGRRRRIILAIDSVVARACIRKGYHMDPRARELLIRIQRVYPEAVNTTFVYGLDNLADFPSRMFFHYLHSEPSRVRYMLKESICRKLPRRTDDDSPYDGSWTEVKRLVTDDIWSNLVERHCRTRRLLQGTHVYTFEHKDVERCRDMVKAGTGQRSFEAADDLLSDGDAAGFGFAMTDQVPGGEVFQSDDF